MGKKNVILLMLFLFSISFITAEAIGQRQDAELNKIYLISQPCATCSYINISVYNKNGVVLNNVPMINNGSTWTYAFTPNTTLRHDVNGKGDINGVADSFAFWFDVTLSGEQTGNSKVVASLIFLLFIVGLIVGLAMLQHRIDFEKWHDKILKKYEHKNFMKIILAGIGYSFMKDSFLIYYLLGWPLLIMVNDIAFTFGLESIYNLLTVCIDLYSVGLFFVGLIFIAGAWQILLELWDKFQNMKWGVDQ